MRLVDSSKVEWRRDAGNVRGGGGLDFKRLLAGRPGTPENYRLNLNKTVGDFETPRHRHNFDQVRIVLEGDMRISPQQIVKEGQVGYFPEGTYYGPYDDSGGHRISMIVQFGGASGNGFMSEEEAIAAKSELLKEGTFKGGVFFRTAGTGKPNQDAFEAVWERAIGKVVYPRPRYDFPIVADPRSFDWKATGQNGVSYKLLGNFTERATRLECVRLEPGASWTSPQENALLLLFVLRGAGSCNDEPYSKHTAIEIEAGETAKFRAADETEIFSLVMPLLRLRKAA